MSIRAKLVIATVAAMVAAAVATFAVVRRTVERNVTVASEREIAEAEEAFADLELAEVEKLDATLQALTAHPGLVEAFRGRDRDRLLALAAPIFARLQEQHGVTHWYFIEPPPARTCFLRVHRPELHGDAVDRATLLRAIETGRRGAGKELGKTAFAIRVVEPWRASDGTLLGYMELGEEIDHFLERMKARTGDDYGLVLEKRLLDEQAWAATRADKRNDWNDRERTVLVQATTAEADLLDDPRQLAGLPDRGMLLGDVERAGRTYARGVLPVADAAGRRVGRLFVLEDITSVVASMHGALAGMLWVLAAVAVAVCALLLFAAQRLVFRRLDRMIETMEDLSARLAGGDYDVVAPPAASRDEIGRFEDFFGRFLTVVAGLLRELTRLKTG